MEMGFVAQEVEPIFPEVVITGGDGYRAIDYSKMVAVLTEAIKELRYENDELRQFICLDHPDAKFC